MIDPKNDGVDHINIYSQGNTRLGRLLSNFAWSPITTLDGKFNSIEGYWYWLNSDSTQKDRLRSLFGFQAKRVGRALRAPDWNNEDTFRLKIFSAMISKLVHQPDLRDLILQNNLPYTHYYVYNGKVYEPEEGKWILDGWTYLTKFLKEKA